MKFKIAVLSVVSLGIVACGDSDNNANRMSTNPMVGITEFEKSGKIPVLNRDYTLVGPDADGNGVRDDIDAYVDGLSDTQGQKAALKQMSAAFTATITADIYDKEALRQATYKLDRAIRCLVLQYSKDGVGRHTLRREKRHTIRKYTINTPERFKAYAAYNKAMSGTVSEHIEGNTCD